MNVPIWLTPREGGGKFTASKELFLWNGMSLIILGKILCWFVGKPENEAWLEQLVSRWNAQKGAVHRVGMERGLISLNDWNRWFNSLNSVSALCVRPREKGPRWQTSRRPLQRWLQTGRQTPRWTLRKRQTPLKRAQGAGPMSIMSFFEIMAVTGVGQEMKLCIHEMFDVIIQMKFFCVPLIGYGGRASAGVIPKELSVSRHGNVLV
jgi:hypothetical protein